MSFGYLDHAVAGLPLLAWPSFRQQLCILIYHRVLPKPDPLRPGDVTANIFDAQVGYLSRHFNVMPLREAVVHLKNNTLPRRACCITFDDGYADNLTVALPILEKYQLTATVFVATGYIDGGRMFNDIVTDTIGEFGQPELDLSDIGLGCHHLGNVEEKRNTIWAILEQIKFFPPDERGAIVEKLVDRAGCTAAHNDTMLTSQQVFELSARGIEIGGHTVAHTILTTLDDENARREISKGKRQLEAIINKPVTTFAYPNGKPIRDYAARHVAMVRDLGFELAVSTTHGVTNHDSDIHQLQRLSLRGNSITTMAARLTRDAWSNNAKICEA